MENIYYLKGLELDQFYFSKAPAINQIAAAQVSALSMFTKNAIAEELQLNQIKQQESPIKTADASKRRTGFK